MNRTRPANRFLSSRLGAALLSALAAMALVACGGGEDVDAIASTTEAAPARPMAAAAVTNTVTMTKVSFTNASGQALTGYVFQDPTVAQKGAAVVLMHGCSGIWSNGVENTEPQPPMTALSHIHRRWGQNLAKAGYVGFLVDSFTARKLKNECNNGTSGLNEAVERPKDALAGRQFLVNNGYVAGDRIALLGWSNGGSATLATMDKSNEGQVGAKPFREAFSFYPGCGLINEFGGDASTLAKTTWVPYAPVSIYHAELDDLYTSGRCTNRVNGAIALGAGSASGNAVAMTVYAQAHHSFDMIDISKSLSSPFTQNDVTAQTTADPLVMNRLATLFGQ